MKTEMISSLVVCLALAACGGNLDIDTDVPDRPGQPQQPQQPMQPGLPTDTTPVEFPLTFGNCPSMTACGGNPVGNWHYSAGCINAPFTQAKSVCGALTVSGLRGTGRGRLNVTATNVDRNVTLSMSATLHLPASCLMGAGTCAAAESALSDFYDQADCHSESGGCACDVTERNVISSVSAYAVTGGQLQASGGSYDFCVSPSAQLQYRKLGSANLEDGLLTVTRQ